MKTLLNLALLASASFAIGAEPVAIFDGKSLTGWDGDPFFWTVEDGAITGTTTKDNPTKGNTFIIWSGGQPGDFELTFEYRINGGNSGMQYRSFRVGDKPDSWVVGGYQADFDAAKGWAGTNYGERFRGVLAKRGEKVVLSNEEKPDKKNALKRDVTAIGDAKELAKKINDYPEWNKFRIVAKGFTLQHYINGVLMAELEDNDKNARRADGIIAFQLHAGPPMKVQARNFQLTELKD